MIYLILAGAWLILGATSGILGIKLSKESATVKEITVFTLAGLITFVVFLVMIWDGIDLNLKLPGLMKFWEKTIIHGKGEEK